MEGQGNILKTLLIAAVIYALALAAPVKRDTSSNSTVMDDGGICRCQQNQEYNGKLFKYNLECKYCG